MRDVEYVGIDLGTTNSAIARWNPETKQSEIVLNREGEALTPSLIAFLPQGAEAIVGSAAADRLVSEPESVAYSVKRYIGLTFRNEPDEIRYYQQTVTYRIEEAARRTVRICLADRQLDPTEASAEVLIKIKRDSEARLGRPIDNVVITVPAYFNRSQRHATVEAGKLAGFDRIRLINEPTAAALAFRLGREEQKVLVYDLGGGTFDVSIIEVDNGVYRVIASYGDMHLGGDNLDESIAAWLRKAFEAEYSFALPADDKSLRARLREAGEEAKIRLSEVESTEIHLPALYTLAGQAYDLRATLSRGQMEAEIQGHIERTIDICKEALAKANEKDRLKGGLRPEDISQVLLVGGQSKTPAVRRALNRAFGWPLNDGVEPGLAVALGAGIVAGYESQDPYLRDEILLRDIITQPLLIKLADGSAKTIVHANEQLPVNTERDPTTYSNATAGQQHIRFRVYQGLKALQDDNPLGEVVLWLQAGPYKAKEAQVKFWVKIDLDGILHVFAQELGAGNEAVEAEIDYFYFARQQEIAGPVPA